MMLYYGNRQPVQEGDYVEVRWKSDGQLVAVGIVSTIGPDRFILREGRMWYAFDQVVVTKLVKET